MTSYLPVLVTIFTLCMMACASPGPNFLTVSSAALAHSRRHAVLTALGIMTGDTIWAVGAVLGMSALLTAVPELRLVLTVGGGLYLAYVGWCLLRSTGTMREDAGGATGFLTAMLVSLTNPKAPIYLASIFAPILAPGTPAWVLAAAVGTVAGASILWYVTVALALSHGTARNLYRRFGAWIDRIAGAMLVLFGLWLVLS